MLNTISTFPLASAFPIFYFPTVEDMATPVSMQIVESTPKERAHLLTIPLNIVELQLLLIRPLYS
jgi:hypothetical protein